MALDHRRYTWHGQCSSSEGNTWTGGAGSKPGPRREGAMSIFYIIGVVVVVLFFLGYFGFR